MTVSAEQEEFSRNSPLSCGWDCWHGVSLYSFPIIRFFTCSYRYFKAPHTPNSEQGACIPAIYSFCTTMTFFKRYFCICSRFTTI